MDQLTVLVPGEDGDHGRPVALEVLVVAHDLTLLGVQVGVRLKPPAQQGVVSKLVSY